ncbi:MAG: hypothetical protein KKH57_07870, partial [Candidatus Omnitrophica bacterium]|nr:hypothetical protein [Candidatus Omnitrophota bacterium]
MREEVSEFNIGRGESASFLIWFLENLTEAQKNFYEAFKRVLDMLGSLIFGIISLCFYPFIVLAIKI